MNDSELFDIWNIQKKKINVKPTNLFPQEKEVWMCVFGKNIGFEQNGSDNHFTRPGLVIKKFNNQMFWVLPLSTKQKDLDFYFNFTDQNNLKVSLILAQLRLLSIKRFKRKMYKIDDDVFEAVKLKLKSFF
ncbi:MAG: type II toxin-antitoxin system PemK/MazF family toxin [bacterium]|nr:type II toxin-antitoxin system PemK/MazF family toxin [bacterium]